MYLRNPMARMFQRLCEEFFRKEFRPEYIHPVEERIAFWRVLDDRWGKEAVFRHGRWIVKILNTIEDDAREVAYG